MAHIIKYATKQKAIKTFQVSQEVEWHKTVHDGRGYETWDYGGVVVKVNRVTVDVEDENGNIWRVNKTEIDR